jgi:hypothetical protein
MVIRVSSGPCSANKANATKPLPRSVIRLAALQKIRHQIESSASQTTSPSNVRRNYSNIPPSHESWQRLAKSIEFFSHKNLQAYNQLLARTAMEFSIYRFSGQPPRPGQTLEELSKMVRGAVEKRLATNPQLAEGLKRLDLTLSGFDYNEAMFRKEIEDQLYPNLLHHTIEVIAHPLLGNASLVLPKHEETPVLNYADFYWSRDVTEFSIPILVKPDVDLNIENTAFNQMAYETISPQGTLIRELAGGPGGRLFNLLHLMANHKTGPKYPAAALAPDMNRASILTGRLALLLLDRSNLPVSIGLGSLLGKFSYPQGIQYQNQVILLSRAFTICDGQRIDDILRHLNRSLKIGDRIICSFASPRGTLLEKNENHELEVPMNNELKGRVFIKQHQISSHEKIELDRIFAEHNISKWSPETVVHSFVHPLQNLSFFVKRGYEIRQKKVLYERKYPILENDRAIVELIKERDV